MTYSEKLIWIAEHNPRVRQSPEDVEKEISCTVHGTVMGWFLSGEEIADEVIRQIEKEISPVRSAAEHKEREP